MVKNSLSALAGAIVSVALAVPAATAEDYVDRLLLLDRLTQDEARGGPQIRGGRSPFQKRVKVCNVMLTPVRDPDTGELVKVMKEVCWME
ncbi:hypothetical protein [Stappia sp. ES.058]|uniref:hypothetical protein n=1 Tax=Stappia sp. ES.058 TaxID=1881061 RepID=UPI00087C9BB5|nr:hypothetical protein [Stappia sp. ES.058]SDU28676.1 hypothetical protein SAMN05428979_2751 [Stappia sp. ES.058]